MQTFCSDSCGPIFKHVFRASKPLLPPVTVGANPETEHRVASNPLPKIPLLAPHPHPDRHRGAAPTLLWICSYKILNHHCSGEKRSPLEEATPSGTSQRTNRLYQDLHAPSTTPICPRDNHWDKVGDVLVVSSKLKTPRPIPYASALLTTYNVYEDHHNEL
jgi:hypothetical protein